MTDEEIRATSASAAKLHAQSAILSGPTVQPAAPNAPTAVIAAVQEDIVRLRLTDPDKQQLVKNEVVYVLPSRQPGERLKAEVLRVRGSEADAQVYESTSGVGLNDAVEQTGQLLSIKLGPGLLGRVFDGLQNPLEVLAQGHGVFLPRGVQAPGLDPSLQWSFTPLVRIGDKVAGGDAIGTVPETTITHKIMAPFDLDEPVEVTWIRDGAATVDEPIARVRDSAGRERTLTLAQDWPVRIALPECLLARGASVRLYPDAPLVTQQRLIDTFFPIAQGGTACIPGPFGAGKTVLQSLISRHADVDVVIVVACGERAGEVVETITEFPTLKDPRTGGSLMDRTVIICNTSSMPVAAREASIYTGLTLGEYYRQMGLRVLLIADSTSRWAQAMRETSGRLEEIPGEEGFPAYLDSSIKAVYERAGVIETNDGNVGALTMIGTVSPAGGNFEEPVTQSTLSAVKCFLGLSAERAYKRFYPAVDPLQSWSHYREQLAHWFLEKMGPDWSSRVERIVGLLHRGDEILQMMQVTGEDGVTLDDFITQRESLFLDMVFLQQDAFDDVDSACAPERQKALFNMVYAAATRSYTFKDKAQARDFFTKLTGLYKNLNYAAAGSNDFQRVAKAIEDLDKSVPTISAKPPSADGGAATSRPTETTKSPPSGGGAAVSPPTSVIRTEEGRSESAVNLPRPAQAPAEPVSRHSGASFLAGFVAAALLGGLIWLFAHLGVFEFAKRAAAPPIGAPSGVKSVASAPAASEEDRAATIVGPTPPNSPASPAAEAANPPPAGQATAPTAQQTPKESGDRNGATVQFASGSSKAEETNLWRQLQKKLPKQLSNREPIIRKVEQQGHVSWLLRTEFTDRAEAASFCEQVRAARFACDVLNEE